MKILRSLKMNSKLKKKMKLVKILKRNKFLRKMKASQNKITLMQIIKKVTNRLIKRNSRMKKLATSRIFHLIKMK